jgi:hypothetical protein
MARGRVSASGSIKYRKRRSFAVKRPETSRLDVDKPILAADRLGFSRG